MARLIPALRGRAPDLPSLRESDSETERYLMYAAVAGLLEAAGEQEPLLLILDDLHWADSPTLSLLRHVVSAGPSMAVMVVGTYRDSELPHDHPLPALLADLHREQGVERMKLSGLARRGPGGPDGGGGRARAGRGRACARCGDNARDGGQPILRR